MKDIDLEYLYEQGWYDLEADCGYVGGFIWSKLEYWRDGNTIIIEPFKIDELVTLSDLEYYESNFESHCDKVRDFCDFLNEQMAAVASMDYDEDEYKRMAQEDWDEFSDQEKEEYNDDFDEYWESYSSSNSFYQMVSDDQEMRWDDLRREFEDEFIVLDKIVNRNGYFDSYGRLNIDVVDQFDDDVDAIEGGVAEFKSTLFDANKMNHQQRIEFFNGLFG